MIDETERKARLKASVIGAPDRLRQLLAECPTASDDLYDLWVENIEWLQRVARKEGDGTDAEYATAVAAMDAAVEAFFAAPKESPAV